MTITPEAIYASEMGLTIRTARKHFRQPGYINDARRAGYECGARLAIIMQEFLPERGYWSTDGHFLHRYLDLIIYLSPPDAAVFEAECFDDLRDRLDELCGYVAHVEIDDAINPKERRWLWVFDRDFNRVELSHINWDVL